MLKLVLNEFRMYISEVLLNAVIRTAPDTDQGNLLIQYLYEYSKSARDLINQRIARDKC